MEMTDSPGRSVLRHKVRERILRPGLSFHVGAEHHSEDFEGEAVVDDHVHIVFALEGSLDLTYGGNPVKLQAPGGRTFAGVRNAAMVTLLEPARFRRVVRRGEFSRRVSIGLAKRWMDDALGQDIDAVSSRAGTHLQTAVWTATPRARVLVEQMLAPPPLLPQLIGLYQESRAIELVIEAMTMGAQAHPLPQAGSGGRLPPALYQRVVALKDWLREHAAEPLRLEQIAAQLHTTPSTLQRHFRQVHGMTVFDCLQQERLQLARQALLRDGVSVGYAATLAGYANATSFATAFRRHFGQSPRQVRQRG